MRVLLTAAIALAGAYAGAEAKQLTVVISKIDDSGVGIQLGRLRLLDTRGGLRIMPALQGLPAGTHGFHVHANPDCGVAEQNGKRTAGMAAGGHCDPDKTGKHRGPSSTEGHKGDLPPLVVDAKGRARTAMVAPRLTVDDVKGHSIMLHGGGDNFADEPAPLGGGGPRIACGVVK